MIANHGPRLRVQQRLDRSRDVILPEDPLHFQILEISLSDSGNLAKVGRPCRHRD